ncbi:MAG: ASKHA domain-containing protein [Dehalococcoidia bacterium]|nr:ASKHA domain-containing protein [Dehalococcoidia bacterium]
MTGNAQKYKVLFLPAHVEIWVEAGSNLLECARSSGLYLNAVCGGEGTCGFCRVIVKTGTVDSPCSNMLSEADYQSGVRQACRSRVMSDLVVEIPPSAKLETAILHRESIQSSNTSLICQGWEYSPPVKKHHIKLSPAGRTNNSSVFQALKEQILSESTMAIPIEMEQKLASLPLPLSHGLTLTLLEEDGQTHLINIEPDNTTHSNLALVFDVGTTAVRGQLLNLNQGQVIAQAVEYNKQILYGADVIARINLCREDGGLAKLQSAVVETLNTLIQRLIDAAAARRGDINHIVVSANTVMNHLLLALDPQYLRLPPYLPSFSSPPLANARSLGLEVGEQVSLFCLPSVASYVGGDVVAGLTGIGVHQRSDLTLYIDIGTNGEIALGNNEWLLSAAASAGPTFEGGGIQCGMLATVGAIEDLFLDDMCTEPVINVIGEQQPLGICGSGLISLTAALLKKGLVSRSGRFNMEANHPSIRHGVNGKEFLLVAAEKSGTGRDIVFNEIDMDNLIRSKAALYSGYHTLVSSVNKKLSDIEHVVIAGTFGNRLNIEEAITIGLLPDLPRHKFIFIGNGSLLGARLLAFSAAVQQQCHQVAAMMTHIELSENIDFMNNYTAAMFLPHTDASLFPSIKL